MYMVELSFFSTVYHCSLCYRRTYFKVVPGIGCHVFKSRIISFNTLIHKNHYDTTQSIVWIKRYILHSLLTPYIIALILTVRGSFVKVSGIDCCTRNYQSVKNNNVAQGYWTELSGVSLCPPHCARTTERDAGTNRAAITLSASCKSAASVLLPPLPMTMLIIVGVLAL